MKLLRFSFVNDIYKYRHTLVTTWRICSFWIHPPTLWWVSFWFYQVFVSSGVRRLDNESL